MSEFHFLKFNNILIYWEASFVRVCVNPPPYATMNPNKQKHFIHPASLILSTIAIFLQKSVFLGSLVLYGHSILAEDKSEIFLMKTYLYFFTEFSNPLRFFDAV